MLFFERMKNCIQSIYVYMCCQWTSEEYLFYNSLSNNMYAFSWNTHKYKHDKENKYITCLHAWNWNLLIILSDWI